MKYNETHSEANLKITQKNRTLLTFDHKIKRATKNINKALKNTFSKTAMTKANGLIIRPSHAISKFVYNHSIISL